jgi:ElaB/YqjD/DUF883 family membrane-anchored ribosome-binding protein
VCLKAYTCCNISVGISLSLLFPLLPSHSLFDDRVFIKIIVLLPCGLTLPSPHPPTTTHNLSRIVSYIFIAESGDWVSVKSLLEHQPPSSLTNCPNLAPLLANSHKYGLLDMLLTSSNGDILSDDLGAVLSSLLSKPSKDAAQAQTEQYKAAKQGAEAAVKAAEDAVKKQKNNAEELMTNAACTAAYVSGFAPSHLALHSLLTVNIDSGLLLGALHHISASQAVALLKYLRIWLSHHDGMLRSVFLLDTASPNSIIVPHLSTVVEWINLTVDSNMTRLMLREDAVGVLSEIKERLVEPQLGEMKGLAAVRGAVEHLQCGAPLAPVRKRVAERYSVEWFDLTVN